MDLAGVSRAAAVGHIAMALAWAVDFTIDGVIDPARLPALARAVEWPGDASSFAAAMTEAGWLDRHGDAWRVHDWSEYVGRLMDQRKKAREKKQRQRDTERGHVPGDVPGTVPALSLDKSKSQTKTKEDPPPSPPPGELFGRVEVDDRPAPTEEAPIPSEGSSEVRYPSDFLAFWAAYPTRKGKAPAFAIWKRHRLTPENVSRLMAALEEDKACQKWRADGGRYIPHPKSWLGEQRWLDDPGHPAPDDTLLSGAGSGGRKLDHQW